LDLIRDGSRFDAQNERKSDTGQRNRGALEHALGPDHDGLLVAPRCQRDVRGKSRRRRDDIKIAVAATSLDQTVDVSAGFIPCPGQGGALRGDIGAEIEFVAVAGAGKGLIEAGAAIAHGVRCATANSFGRPIVQRDRTGAGPVAGHAGKRSRLRVACGAEYGNRKQGDNSEDQPLRDPDGSSRLACFIAVTLPTDRCTVRPQMLHSTFPLRHCH
jgi:hypothetical protein